MDFSDPANWISGFDLGGGGDPSTSLPINPIDPTTGSWVSGSDLPGGGDTGNPVGPSTSFNVGPGQTPSQIYQQLVSAGLLPQGAQGVSVPGGSTGGGSGGTSKGTNGLLTNADGSINWPSLLGMLAPLLSGAYTSSQTGKATQQMLDAINNANSTITSTLGGNPALYQPYRDVGSVGLSRLTSMPQSNLAQQFQPLGTPGMSLNTVARGK